MVQRLHAVLGALLLLLATSCGDSAAGAAGARSNICNNITGGEAILWDLYNGIPRTDSVLPPDIPTGGGVYSNPVFPLLGFVYPAGWTPTTTTGGINNVGVNLVRQDNQAIWREESLTVNGAPNVQAVRDAELQSLLQFIGQQGGQVQNVCRPNEGTGDAGGGIIVSFSNIIIRVGNHTAVISTSVTPFPGLPSSSVRAKVVAAPTAEFPDRAIDTFLAIDWQLLIGESDNLFDRDGDGWRDGVDNFPDDPTRH